MISYLAQASARVCTMEAFVLKRSSRVMPGKLTENGKSISSKDIFFLLEVQNNVPEAEHDRCAQGTSQGTIKSTNILSIEWFLLECHKAIMVLQQLHSAFTKCFPEAGYVKVGGSSSSKDLLSSVLRMWL